MEKSGAAKNGREIRIVKETADNIILCHTPAQYILICFRGAKASTLSVGNSTNAAGKMNRTVKPIPSTGTCSLNKFIKEIKIIIFFQRKVISRRIQPDCCKCMTKLMYHCTSEQCHNIMNKF